MREPIEHEYFNWLCAKVLEPRSPTYSDLLIILHRTEFVWVLPADGHRAEDGLELRFDFLRETDHEREEIWMTQPCSMLELLISFAKRAEFQTEFSVKKWFWIFLENLRLNEFTRVSMDDIREIDEILYTFIWRQYDIQGNGGLFPLITPKKNQRETEIWYQFFEYIDEQQIA
jgi:hypothetical protein